MTRDIFTIELEQSIDDCLETMTKEWMRHFLVIEEGRLLGLISIGDVVKETMIPISLSEK